MIEIDEANVIALTEASELTLLTQAYRDCAQQEHAWRKKRLEAADRIRELLGIPGRGTTLFSNDNPTRTLVSALDLGGKRLSPAKRRQRYALDGTLGGML